MLSVMLTLCSDGGSTVLKLAGYGATERYAFVFVFVKENILIVHKFNTQVYKKHVLYIYSEVIQRLLY